MVIFYFVHINKSISEAEALSATVQTSLINRVSGKTLCNPLMKGVVEVQSGRSISYCFSDL